MNSINYPNYTFNVDNINSLGNTLYLGTNNNVTMGHLNHITNINGMLQINGSSGQSGYVLTNNGTTVDWEQPIYPTTYSKGITGSIQYNDGHSGFTGNTLFTYTYQPSVGNLTGGYIHIIQGNVDVSGTNTKFITQLRINEDLITPTLGGIPPTTNYGKIKEIINDTNLVLDVPPSGSYIGFFYTVPYNKLQVNGDLLPSSANTYSLGNQTEYWRNLYIGPGTITLQNSKQEEGFIGLNDNGILYTDHGLASPFISIGPIQTDVVGKVGGWRLYTEEDASLNSLTLKAQANSIDGTYGTTGPVYTLIPGPSLAQVMSVGNTAGTTLDMSYNDIIRVHGISGSNIYLTTNSLYVNGSSGTAEQVLSVGGTGPKWTSLTTPSLAQVMSVGNTAGTTLDMSYNDIIRVHGISGNNIYLTTNSLYVNGNSGTTGQVLSVGTTGPSWTSLTTPSLAQVMSVGNTAGTTLDMSYNDIIHVHGISGNNIYLTTNSLYVNGSSGTAEQVLSVDETGPKWTSLTTPSLAQVMAVGNTAVTTLDMSYNDIIHVHGISGSNIYLTTNSLYVNGSSGTTGQILSVGGTGPSWTSVSGLKGDTGPTGSSGVTGTVDFNGGTLDFGITKIIYGTYTTLNNTPTGTIYFNDSFTSILSYSLTLTILDPSVTDNSISITQKGTTFADYHMQKGGVGHQINWIAIGH
jgi:hypothetical protein